MQDSPSPSSNIRFGKFEVDFRQGELRRSGMRQNLGPQPFELLRALLERPGELITRDELRQRLWPGNTFVDYELGLKKCVNRVREVLGDSADHPRYIETLPRRGYRFIAPLEQINGAGAFNGAPRIRDAAGFEVQDGRRADVRAEVEAMPAQPADGALLDPPPVDPPGESSVTRLRDTGEARVAIQNAGKPAGFVALLQRTPIVWAAIAGVLLLSIAVLLIREWRSGTESAIATPVRATLELTPAEHLTNDRFGRPNRTAMAFSPDGNVLVFAGTVGTTKQLYKRPLDQAEAVSIPGTEGGDGPFFSPDGKWIGFYADNSLKKVSTSGGPAIPICKLEYPAVWGATWGADGSIVFAEHDLKQVSAQGGEPKVLLKANGGEKYASPEFLSDSRTLLFTNVHGSNWDLAEILALSNGGSPRILLKGGASPRYASAGYLIYMRSGVLLAAPFDASHLEVTGPGVPLLDGVMQAVAIPHGDYGSGIGQFAVSRSGTLVYAGGGIYPPLTGRMVRLDRSGAAADLHFKDIAIGLRLSPDGRRLVATKVASNLSGFNVELYDLERGTSTPLTSDDDSSWPIWSVDGKRVLFTVGCPRCETGEGSRIDSIAADGRGERESVFNKERDEITAASWSRDGRWLAILVNMPITHVEILIRPMAEKGEPRVFIQPGSSFRIFDPEFSPDGKWIAYTSTETGALEVYVQAFPGPGEKHRISTNGGMNPAWAPSGRELFYVEPAMPYMDRDLPGAKMMAVDIEDRASFRAAAPHALFTAGFLGSPLGPFPRTYPLRSYDVYPDGRHFIASLLENPTEPQVTRLNLVLNWFDELKRRVPTR